MLKQPVSSGWSEGMKRPKTASKAMSNYEYGTRNGNCTQENFINIYMCENRHLDARVLSPYL